MACLHDENRVGIHDTTTGNQLVIEIERPWRCASSQHFVAITTLQHGLHLFTPDGVLVHIVPDSTKSRCAAFHPRNTNILATGFEDGSVHVWDVSTRAYVSSFQKDTSGIINIRFAPDYRLFLCSWDSAASIVALDALFQIISSVKLEAHTGWVNDILPLPSFNQCVTCSSDETIKVWDCETGACIRTLAVHTDWVTVLVMHPTGQRFGSGSRDSLVIIWSCETFEVLYGIAFPSSVESLVFGEGDIMYVGMRNDGVLSCNTHTGGVGPVIIPGTCESLSFGKVP